MKAFIREILVILAIAVAIFLLTQVTFPSFYVEGDSMEPNLHPGQRLVINKIVYKLHDPERGDVIVFPPPLYPEANDYIKRIIALPGETIEIKSGVVYINGLELDEPYIEDLSRRSFSEQEIPENEYFVLGDNRGNSSDSRVGWTVPQESIIGKAWLLTWPPSQWGLAPNYSPVLITAMTMSGYLPLSGVAWRG